MKNKNAWVIIVIVLIIAGGAIWYMMNKTNTATPTDTTTGAMTGQNMPGMTHSMTGTTGTTGTKSGTPASTDTRPTIMSITPSSAKVGQIVSIKGVNFDMTGSNVVAFGPTKGLHHSDGTSDNQVASLPASAAGVVTFKVPSAIDSGNLCDQANKCATYGPTATKAGTYMVTVFNKNGLSTEFPFTVTE